MNIGSWKIISHGGTTISGAAMLLFFFMVNLYDSRNQRIQYSRGRIPNRNRRTDMYRKGNIRVYARETDCAPIPVEEALRFIEKYHRQGAVKKHPNSRSYGLYRKDDVDRENLLAVIIFSSPRTSKKRRTYKWELLRMCFKGGVTVVGGASKMIRFFINDVCPVNFFTYQDTSGESTSVYEKSGMTLVEEARPKKVLVKNGINYNKATNNRRDWFSLQQASTIGPDMLIGTSLGEVRDENDHRLSNIDLFIHHCDYHIEEIPGDRVYEWHNKNFFYYTYRITAVNSDKYYYGRKSFYSLTGNYPSEEELSEFLSLNISCLK